MTKRKILLYFGISLICVFIFTSFFGSFVLFGHAVDPDLVLYLPMNEGVGTLTDDESGNGYVGVIDGATWIAGVAGSALEFDGIDDSLYVNKTDILNSVNSVTIACWVKVQAPSQLKPIVLTDGFGLLQDDNNIAIAISVPLTNNAQGPIMLDEWVQITGTFDGVDIKFYVGGVLIATTNWPGTMTAGTRIVVIGFFLNEWWKGAIDELCIWNRALTIEEIEAHYDKTHCASFPLNPVFLALFTLTGVIIFNKKRKKKKFFNTNKN